MSRQHSKTIICPNCHCSITMPASEHKPANKKKKDITIPSSFLLPTILVVIIIFLFVSEYLKAGM